MFRIYLDESGIERGSSYCVVAGFGGSIATWKQFNKRWLKILKRHDIPEFKAQAFWKHDSARQRVGLYRGWTEQKANGFLSELLRCIESGHLYQFSCAINVPDFFTLTEDERRFVTGGRYSLVKHYFVSSGAPETQFHVPMQYVQARAGRIGRQEHKPVSIICDEQHQYAGLVNARYGAICNQYPDMPFAGLSFDNSENNPGLQAADLLCYTVLCYLKRKDSKGVDQPDYVYRSLLKGSGLTYHVFYRQQLKRLIGDCLLPNRS